MVQAHWTFKMFPGLLMTQLCRRVASHGMPQLPINIQRSTSWCHGDKWIRYVCAKKVALLLAILRPARLCSNAITSLQDPPFALDCGLCPRSRRWCVHRPVSKSHCARHRRAVCLDNCHRAPACSPSQPSAEGWQCASKPLQGCGFACTTCTTPPTFYRTRYGAASTGTASRQPSFSNDCIFVAGVDGCHVRSTSIVRPINVVHVRPQATILVPPPPPYESHIGGLGLTACEACPHCRGAGAPEGEACNWEQWANTPPSRTKLHSRPSDLKGMALDTGWFTPQPTNRWRALWTGPCPGVYGSTSLEDQHPHSLPPPSHRVVGVGVPAHAH